MSKELKPVILTGLRANNDLHIGNYFGALLPLVDMAKKHAGDYQINLFVPDLHSFTTPIDHSELQAQILHNLKLFVAAGLPLDNPDVHIYRQSYIPAHSELTVIMNNFTGMGELGRMTQFKDKSRHAKEQKLKVGKEYLNRLVKSKTSEINNSPIKPPKSPVTMQRTPFEEMKRLAEILKDTNQLKIATELEELLIKFQEQHIEELNESIQLHKELEEATIGSYGEVGLFNYPVLMASDILLYGAKYVPVGDDQTQHLEFTRDIAQRMNNRFGKLFVVPKSVKEQHEFFGKEQGLRIKDLGEPTKKMSKSDETGKGIIFLGDDPKQAVKKIMSATTDSTGSINYDPANQPGISNLLQLLSLLQGLSLHSVIDEYQGQTQYGELKKAVAEATEAFLTDFQSRLALVDENALQAKLEASEAKMNEIANATLQKVQKAVGLR